MSRQITVDYEGLSIEMQARCDVAIHSLCKIDKALNTINQNATKFITKSMKSIENELLMDKNKIIDKIDLFKQTLDQYKSMRTYTVYEENYNVQEFNNLKNKLENQLAQLNGIVNKLTGERLEAINVIINQELFDLGERVSSGYRDFTLNEDLQNEINKIEDVSLREIAYREALKDKTILNFDELLSKAKQKYDELINVRKFEVIDQYKEELVKNGIDSEILNNVSTIDDANEAMNEALVNEKVRKETLRVIIKAIRERGFIVDTKNNLKIDRKKNIVKLIALKASGQKAEFEIRLDGKFMYHFDNYEGSACKKDIEPFLEDLHNIYDINILHEEVVWENPDKIQTQKYQYINKNKGTN